MSEAPRPRCYWLERGQGQPLVLLHGLLGHMDHWDAVLESLEPRCRVLAPELPLFDPALPEVSIEGLMDEVVRFMDTVGAGRAVVGGNSLGGRIALALALDHPARVCGLVLTGSSGIDGALVTGEWVEAVRQTVANRDEARRTLKLARAARRHHVESRLGELRVPTLIVWGKDDRITPPEAGERLHALIAGSQLVVLANCGHAPMLEQPAAFNAVLAEWLLDRGWGRLTPTAAALGMGGCR